jgi:nitroreductase
MTTSELISSLNWRYATKKFDPNKKLDESTISTLLETLRLSASSMGLQPYQFIHVKDAAMRAELRQVSFDQSQITDASDLILIAAKKEISGEYVRKYATLEAHLRNRTQEQIDRKIQSTQKYLDGKSAHELMQWNSRQAYIAIGFLLSAAAALKVDACPMEGIKPDEYNRILGLDELNLQSLAVVTLGYRSEDDAYASQAKFRFPKGEIILTI